MCFHSSLSLQSWMLRESARQDGTGLIIRQDFKRERKQFLHGCNNEGSNEVKMTALCFLSSCTALADCRYPSYVPCLCAADKVLNSVAQEQCYLFWKHTCLPIRAGTGQKRVIFLIPSTIVGNIVLILLVTVAARPHFFNECTEEAFCL